MTVKVLLDTDIGSDIDDAVCLSYLLAHPDCDLLGITTVSGQARVRAGLASALCHAAGKELPIHAGTEEPLLAAQQQPDLTQADALLRWPHNADFESGTAVEFLRRTIHDNPREIVLLTIGPLTNIALLFAMDPEVPRLLKGLVSMAGSFWSGARDGLEWNVVCDPHAAAMVYHTQLPYHRSVGLDVTTRVTMTASEFRERFATDYLQPVLDFAEPWFKGREIVTFHDPLAATTIFHDQICHFKEGAVKIGLNDDQLGLSTWSPDHPETHHSVAASVNTEAFFEHYFAIVSNAQ